MPHFDRLPFVVAVLMLVPTFAQAQTSPNEAARVTTVVESFHQAMATGDTIAMLALLAPDARILEGGGIETVEDYQSGHMRADVAFAQAVPRERSEAMVFVEGSVAWVVSTSHAVGTYRDRKIDSRGGELMVLTRGDDGLWKIRSISWS